MNLGRSLRGNLSVAPQAGLPVRSSQFMSLASGGNPRLQEPANDPTRTRPDSANIWRPYQRAETHTRRRRITRARTRS